MKKVLILTAGFGDGHNAAARNVREALEQSSADVEVTVADLYERSYKRLNHIAKKAYLGAVRYALWAGFFKLLDRSPWLADGRGMARLQQTLAQLVEETQPDCVVATPARSVARGIACRQQTLRGGGYPDDNYPRLLPPPPIAAASVAEVPAATDAGSLKSKEFTTPA